MEEPRRILEFYSGIGGMRYSLMRAGIRAEVIEAFDINDTANDVYEHNFGHRPFQGNIQSLTSVELDKYAAHAWLLSPPCQPYTRQGLQKHSADARAFSFIKILELIPHMKQPPQMLFVENVVGFETSDTHMQMLENFANIGFITQEFILSPLQFGIPYSRPRYFCLAKRKPLSFQNPSFDNQLLWTPPLLALKNSILKCGGHHLQDGILEESLVSCEPVKNFLETQTMYIHQFEHSQLDFCQEHDVSLVDFEDNINNISAECCDSEDMRNINVNAEKSDAKVDRGGTDEGALDIYAVPQSLIDRWGSAMDIVYPDSTRCCCFTKSYYRYVKGTGSLLATSEFSNQKSAEKPELCSLKELGLRYFTPREVANLHSFPEDFQFPPHVTVRQRYALLGNSLSITVVASLFHYLFAEPI